MASERTILLTQRDPNRLERKERREGEREREKNKRILERERVYLLSRFSGDRSVKSLRGKRQN